MIPNTLCSTHDPEYLPYALFYFKSLKIIHEFYLPYAPENGPE